MWEIPVYKNEVSDGVADKVRACSSLAYASLALVDKHETARPADLVIIERFKAKAEQESLDLYHLKTVLASTGWNGNDDVFDRSEIWAARATPEDKPFNYGHDEKDIIGHITSSYAFSDDQKILASIQAIDELPEKFHIATGAVLYKFKSDVAAQDRVNKLIAEIEDGKWFVSMECLFKNFDYAVIEPDGTQKVIARNEQTSFLTKYLRSYGGKGKYEGKQVGRLMRNFVFSAVALVQSPANPDSKIFEKTKAFTFKAGTSEKAPVSLGYKSLTQNHKESKVMSDLEILNDKVSKLEAEKAVLEAKLKDHDAKAVASLQEVAKAQADKLLAVEVEKATLAKAIEDGVKASDALKVKLTAAETELSKIQAEQKLAKRIETVIEKLKADKETASKLVANLMGLSDEVFDAAVAAMPGYSDTLGGITKDIAGGTTSPDLAKPKAVTPGAPVNPPMSTSPISEANPIAQKVIDNKGAAALVEAEPIVEPALAVATDANKIEKTIAEIQGWYLNEKEGDQ